MSKSRRLAALACGLSIFCLSWLGCRDRVERIRPDQADILLVTIDTLRADHTSAYGYPIDTTPNLRALAESGWRFQNMYATSSTTGPSHAALFSGRPQRSVNYMKNGHILHEDVTTLAEVLAEAGYETAAFVSSGPVQARFGFGQGFQTFDSEPGEAANPKRGGTPPRSRRGDETATAVVDWLRTRRDPRSLFLWVHFFDPHSPYKAPEQLDASWPAAAPAHVRAYDSEVHFVDSQLGRVLAVFEQKAGPAGAIVAVTADHGEGLGDHDWRGHGVNLHEEAVRIPLILAWDKKLAPGRVVEAPASLMDVAPTILDLAGIRPPADYEGLVLSAADLPKDRPIFIQRREYRSKRDKGKRVKGEMIAVIKDRWKYIRAPQEKRFELYDTARDPHEARNVAKSEPKKRREFDALVETWLADHPPPEYRQPELSEEDRRQLRALGYVD